MKEKPAPKKPTNEEIEKIKVGEIKNLKGLDLRGANLSGANLAGVDLQGAYLSGADLRGANLSGATLTDAWLTGAKLQKANLAGAKLQGANLLGSADLQGANLTGVELQGCNLRSAQLKGAILTRANLEGAHLENANLGGATLKRANLRKAHLENADLDRANLKKANLQAATLTTATLKGANLKEAHIDFAKLQFATLNNADLTNATLTESDFRAANLTKANLTNALLKRTNLRASGLKDANMEGANLQDCLLSFTYYSSGAEYAADLYQTKFSHVELLNFKEEDEESIRQRKAVHESLKDRIFASYSARLGIDTKKVFVLAMMRLEGTDFSFSPLEWGTRDAEFQEAFNKNCTEVDNDAMLQAIRSMRGKIKKITGEGEESYERQRVSGADKWENLFKSIFPKKDARSKQIGRLKAFEEGNLEDLEQLNALFKMLFEIKIQIEAEDNRFPSKLLEQVNAILAECTKMKKGLEKDVSSGFL